MTELTIIVVGNGMVGHKFCEKLISKSFPCKIVVFGEEPRRAYDRVHLSEYFNNKSVDDLSLSAGDWYSQNGIDLYLNDPVKEINRVDRTVLSRKGHIFCGSTYPGRRNYAG